MTMKLTFKEHIHKKQSLVLPVVARTAIVLLPLISALPLMAQTNAKGGSEIKATTSKKMTSAAGALSTSLQPMGKIAAEDTFCQSDRIVLTHTAKPTPVKRGDVIAQAKIEEANGKCTGSFTVNWEILKVDSQGIEVINSVDMRIHGSEAVSGGFSEQCRVDYGKETAMIFTVHYPDAQVAYLLKITAGKGSEKGTATVTAVF